MSTLALIGSGEMGGTVARLAVAAGLDVVLSNSRGPQTLSGLVDQLGTRATAATVEHAAWAGDWVVLAVPFGAHPQIPVDAAERRRITELAPHAWNVSEAPIAIAIVMSGGDPEWDA